MDRAFWLERWQKQQIGFHQTGINRHLQRFWPRLDATAGSGVFVPLAGKSLDMLWLRSQGYRVLGVELSAMAVEQFFADNGLQPEVTEQGAFKRWSCGDVTLLCGDFFDLRPADLSDCDSVYDRASLVALPPAMRPDYAARLRRLMPTGPILLVTMRYPQQQMSGPPFSVERQEVEQLYQDGYRIELLDTVDILDENPRFRDKGLTRLHEQVFLLRHR